MYKKRKQLNMKILIIFIVIAVFFGISVSVYMSRSNFLGVGIIKYIFKTNYK